MFPWRLARRGLLARHVTPVASLKLWDVTLNFNQSDGAQVCSAFAAPLISFRNESHFGEETFLSVLVMADNWDQKIWQHLSYMWCHKGHISPRLVLALSAARCWLRDVQKQVCKFRNTFPECRVQNVLFWCRTHFLLLLFFHPFFFFVIGQIMCESLLMRVPCVPAKF